jgi:aspartate/methionine/tyrosine aminotransferase
MIRKYEAVAAIMTFPERFSNLPEYAFPRLRTLLDAHAPGGDVVHMTIGEPRHPMPDFVGDILTQNLGLFAKYPDNFGTPDLLGAIATWIKTRFGVTVDPATQVMALNGTREGLMNACIALSPERKNDKTPVVLIPNPFYQVYAVAAVTVGAEPVYVPATRETGFLPDYAGLSADVLDRTTIAYICSPSNPQGAVATRAYYQDLIALAEKHDFKIFADECYSEIYRFDPPVGALEVAHEMRADPERVAIFHSLSKRSNLPGLRSGFVASGPGNMKQIKQLRAYSGAPLPQAIQAVSARVWADEAHVVASRQLYAEKLDMADVVFSGIAGAQAPEAGFFLWLPVEDGEQAALKLWTETGVRVVPGGYWARDVNGENPGKNYIRVALVAPKTETQRGLTMIRDCLYG